MASQMTEEDLKWNIKSLITSTTMATTISSLERDFKEMIGTPIPFRKFQYNSVEHLLKSIPDTCVVYGTGPFAQVCCVRSEKSGHVQALVAHQKSNTKGRRRFPPLRRYNRAPPEKFPPQRYIPPRFRGGNYNNDYAISPNASFSSESSSSYKGGPVSFKLMAYANPPNSQINNSNFNRNQNAQSRNTTQPNTSFNNQQFQTNNATEIKAAPAQPQQNGTQTQLIKEKSDNLTSEQNYNWTSKQNDNLTAEKKKFTFVKAESSRNGLATYIKTRYPAQIGPAEMSSFEAKVELRNTRTAAVKKNVENWIEASRQSPASSQSMDPLENIRTETGNNIENWIRAFPQTPVDEEIIEPLERLNVTNEKSKPELSEFDKIKEDTERDTSSVPSKVQERLKKLISEFPEGIWVSELPQHYQSMFRRELVFTEYGYASLIEMCVALKHIFHYARPGKDDFKLYDRSKPLPDTAERLYTMASYDIGQNHETGNNYQDALPELDWSDFQGQIPEDVFRLGRTIPRQFLPEHVREESIMDVVVVEAYDPSKFWIYLGTEQDDIELHRLMKDIQDFYCYGDTAREYAIPPGLIKENLYCVHQIYGEYHRAVIVHIYQEEEYIKVFCIDYGTTARVPIRGTCFLHNKFSEVPAQAIRCSLANIIPTVEGHPWSDTVKNRFRELINLRDTKINISHIDHEQLLVYVFLADVTNPKKIVYINDVLVKEKHALWDGQVQEKPLLMTNFTCKVENLHLFPTHLELECGASPSVTELYPLDDMLVPLNFYMPNYFTLNDQEQVLNNKEKILKQIDPSYAKTVTKHSARHFANWTNALTNIHKPVKIDFSLFNDLEKDLNEYYKPSMEIGQSTIISNERLTRDGQMMEEDLFCDVEEELLPENISPSHENCTKEELLNMNDPNDLSNSVISKLTNYRLLDEVSSNGTNKLLDEQLSIIPEFRYSKDELLNIRKCAEELPNSMRIKLKTYRLLNEKSSRQRNAMNSTKQLFNEQVSELRYSYAKEEMLDVRDRGKKLSNSIITKLKKYRLLDEVTVSSRVNAMNNSTKQFSIISELSKHNFASLTIMSESSITYVEDKADLVYITKLINVDDFGLLVEEPKKEESATTIGSDVTNKPTVSDIRTVDEMTILCKKLKPFRISYAFGINANVGVINLTQDSRKELIFSSVNSVIMYDYCTKKARHLQAHPSIVNSISIDANGDYLVSTDDDRDGCLIVWCCKTLNPLFNIYQPYPDGAIIMAALSGCARYLVILGDTLDYYSIDVWLWTLAEDKPNDTYLVNKSHGKPVKISFHPDKDEHIMVVFETQVFFLTWHSEENKLRPTIIPQIYQTNYKIGEMTCGTYMKHSHSSYVSTSTGCILLFRNTLYTQEYEEGPLRNKKMYINAVKVTKSLLGTITATSNRILVTGDSRGTILFFDRRIRLLFWIKNPKLGRITSISFALTPKTYSFVDSKVVVKYSPKVTEQILECQYNDMEAEITDLLDTPKDVSMDNNPFLLSDFFISTADSNIFAYDFIRSMATPLFHKADAPISCIDAHDQRPYIVLGFENGRITIINYESKQTVSTFLLPKSKQTKKGEMVSCIKYSRQGLHLVCGRRNGEIWILDPSIVQPRKTEPFQKGHSQIMKIDFAYNAMQFAYYDDNRTVVLFNYNSEKSCWEFRGKIRSHSLRINDMMFFSTNRNRKSRLYTIGADRYLLHYNNLAIKNNDKKPFIVTAKDRIEQSALPMNFTAYTRRFGQKAVRYILFANNKHKIKMMHAKSKTPRSLTVAPSSDCFKDAQIRKMKIPSVNNSGFMIFMTEKHLGISILPPDGNPFRSVGFMVHPKQVTDFVLSRDGKEVFTFGQNDRCVLQWEIEPKSVELVALMGGTELEPFYSFLDGGRNGSFVQEVEELFYYTQALQQENFDVPRKISDCINLNEVPHLAKACGFFPSNFELEMMMLDIRFRDYDDDGQIKDEVSFVEFLKLLINHMPYDGYSIDEVKEHFEVLCSMAEHPRNNKIDRQDFVALMQTDCEGSRNIHACLTRLLGVVEFGPNNYNFLPTSITKHYLIDKILGIETEQNIEDNDDDEADIEEADYFVRSLRRMM